MPHSSFQLLAPNPQFWHAISTLMCGYMRTLPYSRRPRSIRKSDQANA